MINGLLVFSFTLKQVVSVELAVEFSVQEAAFLGRLQSYTLHRGLIGGDNPSGCAGELMFESRANAAIQILHLLIALQPLSVGRVEHH